MQIQWHGYVQIMEDGRLPILGRRKRGRPELNWAEGIRGLMGEKGLIEEDWNGRGNWRKTKIYL